MHTAVRLRHLVALTIVLLQSAACAGSEKSVAPVVSPDALRGLTISPSTGSVVAGQTLPLTAVPDAASASVTVANTFMSSTPSVATVSSAGVVTGVTAGTSIITVSATGTGTGFTTVTKSATATITVLPAPDALRSVALSPNPGNVTVGLTLSLVVVPDVAAPTVTVSNAFASATPAVATVSPTGVVTGVSPGTSVITITATGSGSGFTTTSKTATAIISVSPAPDALRGLTVSPSTGSVIAGRTLSLIASVDAVAPSVGVITTYVSGTPTVASVSAAGVVSGIAAGTSVITVTAVGSGTGFTTTTKTALATITVSPAPDALVSVTLTPTTASTTVGSTLTLVSAAQVAGANVTVSNAFVSATPAVATVSSTGVVTGVTAGTSVITVTATGSGVGFTTTSKTATATITITPPIFAADQFVSIAAGSFVMGSATSGFANEAPTHTVTLSAFQIQKTELTQGQWRAVTGRNPSFTPLCGDSCPVDSVSWDDVQVFLARLNQLDPGKDYRLPTEAQWEYAARAGTTGDYGVLGAIEDIGWYDFNSNFRYRAVALKRPNAWGLYDMSGNVLEHVQDFYSATYYATSPTNDPQGPATGPDHVIRGGSCSSPVSNLRSAYRTNFRSSAAGSAVGFRLARNP